jgi:hypothetical protein
MPPQSRFSASRPKKKAGCLYLAAVVAVASGCAHGPRSRHPAVSPGQAQVNGIAYEIRDARLFRGETVLLRLHADGRSDLMDRERIMLGRLQWTHEGDTLLVKAADRQEVWLRGQTRGRYVDANVGRMAVPVRAEQVDYDTYRFPLRAGEVIILVTALSHEFSRFKVCEVCHDPRCTQCACDQPAMIGLWFRVDAPQELQGWLVHAHHDGDIASGPICEKVIPGRRYLWRTQLEALITDEWSLCSIALWAMEDAEQCRDPRFRQGPCVGGMEPDHRSPLKPAQAGGAGLVSPVPLTPDP